MKILILGYSKLFRKRILKTLIKKKIKFYIASKSSSRKERKALKWFRDYKSALESSDADLVYISLQNSFHYFWAKKALNNNYHVVVDKPITETFAQAKELVKIAKRRKRLLVEATFFNYHRQFKKVLKLFKNKKDIEYINSNFIIPFPNNGSFRLNKKQGGGCAMDMGSYAASISRILGSGKLLNIKSNVYKNKKDLIISFDVYCKFEHNKYFGYFSFGGEYKNNLTLFGREKQVELNYIFSPPSQKNLKILFKKNNILKITKIKKDNIFENFIKEVLFKLSRKKFDDYYKKILLDSKFRKSIN